VIEGGEEIETENEPLPPHRTGSRERNAMA